MKYLCIAILLIAGGGCVSQGPWEDAQPTCLDYANASCRAAQDENYTAGVIEVTLRGTAERHALTWVIANGKTLFWDGAFGCYRKTSEFATVHRVTEGQSKGSYDYIEGPTTNACPL